MKPRHLVVSAAVVCGLVGQTTHASRQKPEDKAGELIRQELSEPDTRKCFRMHRADASADIPSPRARESAAQLPESAADFR